MSREVFQINQILLFTLGFLSFLTEPTLSTNNSLSPDSVRLYHDIVSGHGLYNGFTKLTELGGTNFKSTVFHSDVNKLWLVEFYNSWCGHCHKFAPTWKTLASDVFEWRDVVGIGAVDCANDANNQLCRDLEVMYYPMIKLFPPHSDEKFLGDTFDKGTVDEMRTNLVSQLKIHSNKIEDKIVLKPVSDVLLDQTLWTGLSREIAYIVLLFEPEDSLIGAEVALDLSRIKEVRIMLVSSENEKLAQQVGIEQGSNGAVVVETDLKTTNLHVDNLSRNSLNKAVREFLVSRGINVPLELASKEVIIAPEVNIGDVMAIMQMEEEIKKKLHTTALNTVVFQVDLEGAIRYSLKNEIPLHRNITGQGLQALKNYMDILIKYFPFGQQGQQFLRKLKSLTIADKQEVSGKEFRQTFLRLESEYKPFLPEQGWIGCRGSQPTFRGYPCSLWTLFHTLTVHEELKDRNRPAEGPEVLHAMAGYIKNFFTCSDCAAHFTEMAKTIAGNVTTQNDSVFWLWAAHNTVNRRLSGDQTEDPEHKKIQFPNKEACPTCRASDESWNKTEVFRFLHNMYSNIVYLQINEISSTTTTQEPTKQADAKYDKSLRHEMYGDDQGFRDKSLVEKRSSWDFNIFDISLCVVLYVCSISILALVCIKFVFKRSYRKKPYIHDILSKV